MTDPTPRRRRAPAQPDHGTVLVRRTAYGRPPEEREARLPVPVFEGETARVTVGNSATRKMGTEFEFMKVEVRVELPCLANEMDIRETIHYAAGLIEEFINGPEVDRGDAPTMIAVERRQPGTPIA